MPVGRRFSVELLLEHQPRVLAQGVKADLRPVRLDRAQLGVLDQHRRRVDRVVGDAVLVRVDEALQLLRAAVGGIAGDQRATWTGTS